MALFGNTAEAKIKINYDGKSAERGMKALGSTVKNLAAGFGGLFIINQVNGFMKESARLAGIQQQSNQKLVAVLKSTKEAAGLNFKELKRMSAGLQQVTTVGDETIESAQALLLTFTKINKDVFPEATELTLDMAAALNNGAITAEGLRSSSIQLGKALQDPILGVTALRRVGVNLSKQQQINIKELVQTGKLHEAQKMILKELQTEFGGMSRALAETDAGHLEQVKNNLGDIQEDIGEKIIPLQTQWNTLLLNGLKLITGWQKGFNILGQILGGTSKEVITLQRFVDEVVGKETDQQKRLIMLFEEKNKIIKEEAKLKEQAASFGAKGIDKDLQKGFDQRKAVIERAMKEEAALMDAKRKTKSIGGGVEGGETDAQRKAREKAIKDAAKSRAALVSDAEKELKSIREANMKQTHDGRIALLRQQEDEALEMLFDTGKDTAENISEIEKFYQDQRNEQWRDFYTEREQLSIETADELALIEQERIDALKKAQDEEDELIKKDKDRQDQKVQNAQDAINSISVINNAFATMNDAITNREINNLDKLNISDEEREKRKEAILKEAEEKARAFARVQQAIIIAQTIANTAAMAVGSGRDTFGGPITRGLAMAASIASGAAQIAVIQSQHFETGRMGDVSRSRNKDDIQALLGRGETVVPATQTAMHQEELRAIMNNTANTANGMRNMKGGTVVFQGVSTEQMLQAQLNINRKQLTGTRI